MVKYKRKPNINIKTKNHKTSRKKLPGKSKEDYKGLKKSQSTKTGRLTM